MKRKTKSLIFGIIGLGLVIFSLFIFGFLSIVGSGFGLAALIFHFQSKKANHRKGGGSITGLITGSIAFVIGFAGFVLYLIQVLR